MDFGLKLAFLHNPYLELLFFILMFKVVVDANIQASSQKWNLTPRQDGRTLIKKMTKNQAILGWSITKFFTAKKEISVHFFWPKDMWEFNQYAFYIHISNLWDMNKNRPYRIYMKRFHFGDNITSSSVVAETCQKSRSKSSFLGNETTWGKMHAGDSRTFTSW